jgi:hypothetical protein
VKLKIKGQVRCWKLHVPYAGGEDEILITYPEGHYGHKLISCIKCGQVYAAAIEDELYHGPSLEERVRSVSCIGCHSPLEETYAPYPEKFRSSNGEICDYNRPKIIPDDDESVVVELPDIYSDEFVS